MPRRTTARRKRKSPARGVYWNAERGTYVLDVRWKRLRGGRMVVDLPSVKDEAADAAAAIRTLYQRGEDDAIERFRKGELEIGLLRAAVRGGEYAKLRRTSGGGPTIEQAVEWYKHEVADNRRPRTLTVYGMTADMLATRFSGRRIRDIHKDELLEWYRESKGQFGRPWSPRRRQQVYVVGKKLWKVADQRMRDEATREGVEPVALPNPWSGIERPTIRRTQLVFLTRDEWRRIRKANEGRARLALVGVLTLAGLRLMEAAHLRRDVDVDLDANLIRIQERGGMYPWSIKNYKPRTVPVCGELREIIDAHYGAGFAPGTYVFRTPERDAPMHASTVTRWVMLAFSAGEVLYGRENEGGRTAHTCRHTFATWLLLGRPPEIPPTPLHVVADLLGDDPKTVLNTYAQLLPVDREGAIRSLDAMLVREG